MMFRCKIGRYGDLNDIHTFPTGRAQRPGGQMVDDTSSLRFFQGDDDWELML